MKCEVSIDWLTFSVKVSDPDLVIRDYLGMDPAVFQDVGYGLLGYDHVKDFSDIKVCYAPRENDYFQSMGVCVSMTGNGCRSFETMTSLDGNGSPFTALFLRLAGNPECNVSRVDIACDDRAGVLDMQEIINKVMANDINSRMARRQIVTSFDGQQRDGSTVYIGSPSSEFRIRIYDKALEQHEAGHWIRVELVLRGDHASGFVDQAVVFQELGKLAAEILNDKFSFIERDDSNISRCSVSAWWESFVDELASVCLVSRKVIQHRLEEIDSWLEDQIGPSMAMILSTFGRARLFEIAHDSQRRLTNKQQALVNDYNKVRRAAVTAFELREAERRYENLERFAKAQY